MAYIDWRYEVVKDYRDRILVDPDNPILALQANRDRYSNGSVKSRPECAGLSHLGSSESTNAMLWNVFRSLQKVGRLDVITHELEIGEPRGLLLWALAPELDTVNADFQYVANDLMRRLGTSFSEGVAAPDVIVLGTTGVAVGIGYDVPQLGEGEQYWWEGSRKHVGQLRAYREKNPGFIKEDVTGNELMPVYQLVKLAAFARELSAHFGVESVVSTLASSRSFSARDRELGRSAADWWDTFVGMLGENAVKCKRMFWQDMPRLIQHPSMLELSQYLLTHPCLYGLTSRFYDWDGYESVPEAPLPR
jgi:hypothetical protein